jgi:hypothetical protein
MAGHWPQRCRRRQQVSPHVLAHHQDGGTDHCDEFKPEDRKLRRCDVSRSDPQRPVLDRANDTLGDDQHVESWGPHVGQELLAGEMEMAKDNGRQGHFLAVQLGR